ncbi:hypothetical protein IQ247_14850 [Plectonema cf. radiosum LEGE 06105]|uniref:Uncharacterized protein n=1 Tax=Plectonema cf. radiosum LEGE 06105 TaxID=945769 RepID=A0A8J7JTM8_9CYAN|nr:hypothetical protein [Plectonema radiosum]MBE9213929.1 hypothetical protein [Plectonema cf. radiosum LEGE 06105]
MFIQNNPAKNMTQNQSLLSLRVWRSPLLGLVNLLVMGGTIVFGGELVLGEDTPTPENRCLIPGCPPMCVPLEACKPPAPAEPIVQKIIQLYPAAVEQLQKDDPQAIEKLYQGDRKTWLFRT